MTLLLQCHNRFTPLITGGKRILFTKPLNHWKSGHYTAARPHAMLPHPGAVEARGHVIKARAGTVELQGGAEVPRGDAIAVHQGAGVQRTGADELR
jgi:hypothetical protein